MNVEALNALKKQAERLLMVYPGHFDDATIHTVKKAMLELYDFDCRNPETGKRGKEISSRMLNWISACEWIQHSQIPSNGIKTDEYGIFKWFNYCGDKIFAVWCHDAHHYKLLPMNAYFQGEEYSKTNWNSTVHWCYYKVLGDDFPCCF